jgi:hypothetical protein
VIEGAEKLGKLAAEVMQMIDEATIEDGCEARVGAVAVVVELNVDEDDGPGFTEIRYRHSDSRRWVQAGFFEAATRAVIEGVETEGDDD